MMHESDLPWVLQEKRLCHTDDCLSSSSRNKFDAVAGPACLQLLMLVTLRAKTHLSNRINSRLRKTRTSAESHVLLIEVKPTRSAYRGHPSCQ